jgi:hypothetical protein
VAAAADTRWYEDRTAWRLVASRYLPLLAGFNLAWEIGHMPLYTLWEEGEPGYIAFSILHCTVGDVMIGAGALAAALLLARARAAATWNWLAIASIATALGLAYTLFSEWLNTEVRGAWAYGSTMPVVRLGSLEFGVTPMLQWLLLPPLALWLARRA